ncbi:hypothetical protein KJ564_07210, partial [bacterium]|nr:hypothetical protein [bacterium]
MRKAIVICLMMLLTGSAYAVVVDGYAYLGGQTNHEGIKVLFEADSPSAVTDSTFTDSTGYYSIDVSGGIYDVYFTFSAYQGEELLDQNLFFSFTLPYVTIYKHLSGNISGVIEKNIYIVDSDLYVPLTSELILSPGVEFRFNGHFKIDIDGHFLACGTSDDSIVFKPNQGIDFWSGIEIWGGLGSSDTSKFEYCSIIGCDNRAIFFSSNRKLILNHSILEDNSYQSGGGGSIFCYYSKLDLNHCVFKDNSSSLGGGAIQFSGCNGVNSPIILNCNFIGNSGPWGGA